ncbi:hypothetical protein CR513_29207, partial [Mucuna pruriens]
MACQLGLNGHSQKSPGCRRHDRPHKDTIENSRVLGVVIKDIEQAIEDLEQQNLELRTEIGQMKKRIDEMFELLTLNTTLNAATSAQGPNPNTVVTTQGTPTYPPRFTPQYGMPLGWNSNTKGQAPMEGHEQVGNSTTRATQGSGASLLLIYAMGPYAQAMGALNLANPSGKVGPTSRAQAVTPSDDKKINSFKEWMRIIEGTDSHGLDATDLCLMSDITLLADFKAPKFEKYKGSSCPQVHLAMYYRKMAAYIHQDKILVHYFQDSLTGAALSWYVSLEKGQVNTWRDLAEAFVCQYNYNVAMAPDRSRLQNLSKTEFEGFKNYAERWRELVAQV